jgi:tRNA 2-thiouridine synthesizing protein A
MMATRLEKVGERSFRLDVRGMVCPYPTLYTLRALGEVDEGAELEVITDSLPSCQTVPKAAAERGHEVIGVEKLDAALWKIRIRRRGSS